VVVEEQVASEVSRVEEGFLYTDCLVLIVLRSPPIRYTNKEIRFRVGLIQKHQMGVNGTIASHYSGYRKPVKVRQYPCS